MQLDLESLAAVSRRIGARTGYIQGGGGNTSLKDDRGRMAIKASGVTLATIEAGTGFIPLDAGALREGLVDCHDETAYGVLLRRCVLDAGETRRPSIESGFHALMGACVIHTHSVWANLLTCSQEGRARARDILPDALWVGYATPGIALTRLVAETMGGARPQIVLLENHGLVVAGPDPEATATLHEEVNRTVIDAFGRDLPFPWPGDIAEEDEDLLFPDQAVYTCDPALRSSQAGIETRQAVSFLLAAMASLKLSPHFLSAAERSKLVNLESEKYRQKMVRA
ncbi:class II aldolase/adducin family protein [Aureimonas endophytica]|nr:class II aldolase/adducin family protein [Aureimonas endophytica]